MEWENILEPACYIELTDEVRVFLLWKPRIIGCLRVNLTISDTFVLWKNESIDRSNCKTTALHERESIIESYSRVSLSIIKIDINLKHRFSLHQLVISLIEKSIQKRKTRQQWSLRHSRLSSVGFNNWWTRIKLVSWTTSFTGKSKFSSSNTQNDWKKNIFSWIIQISLCLLFQMV